MPEIYTFLFPPSIDPALPERQAFPMPDPYQQRQDRTEWFRQDRFGLFIHWGLYAIPARGEWVRSVERIRPEAYQAYFDGFNPDRYDPRSWARMAKAAGMRYAVLTTKHHDGFCLFDSQLTEYKSTRTPARRDLVREYVEAFRSEGLKVGFYHSLLDWHHPDYPHHGDRHHPLRDDPSCAGRTRCFDRYLDYLHGQVRELLTRYGKIDILWFDFSYDHLSGEAWRASQLVAMIRALQPGIVLNHRLGGNITAAEPESYAGDFRTPEQLIPPEPVVDEKGRPIPWESCITQNGNWGYHKDDQDFLSARQTLRCLVNCVSKGGNLLVNAGPDARGAIPAVQQQIWAEIGEWMDLNGESIYGAGPSEFPQPEWGRLTQKGRRLFCHVPDRGMGTLTLPGLKHRLRLPHLLATGHGVAASEWFSHQRPHDAIMILPRKESPLDPVVEWEIVD